MRQWGNWAVADILEFGIFILTQNHFIINLFFLRLILLAGHKKNIFMAYSQI